jgi:hypothetical protein
LRGDRAVATTKYVLDFDDPDRRFGLQKLSGVFDLQLLACLLGAAMALISRYSNTNRAQLENTITTAFCDLYDFGASCEPSSLMAPTYNYAREIIPDFAQLFIVLSPTISLFVILWIASVKLLPLKHVREREGRLEYLRQLIVPGAKYDLLLNSGDLDDVNRVVARFAEHDFWPTGDQRAGDALTLCTFVVLLMIFPIVPHSLFQWAAFGILFIISLFVSKIYLAVQRHMLVRVDKTLI